MDRTPIKQWHYIIFPKCSCRNSVILFLMSSKILLVPAWYPSSFFIEQMNLVEDAFEFKVLVGKKNIIGKKSAIRKIISGKFEWLNWNIGNSNQEKKQVITVDYSYINSLPKIFEQKQYNHLNNCFYKVFDKLVQSGWKPDLIHIQSLSDVSVFVCNCAEKYGIPVILTEHIVYVRRDFNFFQSEKERVYSRVNKVLCASNYVYRNLLMNGFTLKDVEIIGNFVEDKFVPQTFGKKDIDNKILFVASHFADKDIEVLIEAVKILIAEKFTVFTVDIIGIDPNQYYQNEDNANYLLKREIDSMGLSEYFDIKGIMTKGDLLKAYKSYSILVSTSLSETFGLAVAEAILNGLPVVCTDSGGISDFVNESNGIIVPIRNPIALACAIKELLKNLPKYDSLKISNKIRQSYGVKAFSEKISNEYRKLII